MKLANVSFGYSHFSTNGDNFKEGDKFISVSISMHNQGMGSPCLNRQEALESARWYLKDNKVTKVDEIEFQDTTDEKFLPEELFIEEKVMKITDFFQNEKEERKQ